MPLADIATYLHDPYLISILLYLLALVGVGVYKTKAVQGSEDFMVAGRTLPWYVLVGTLLATWIGSGSLFSGAGLGYRNGLAGLWSSGGAWLGIVLVFFIARRVRNFGKVTVPDIFRARYGGTAAVLATITTVIAYLTIVSYQFRGGGRVLSMITDDAVSVEAGIVITAVFAISYTVLAGMFSVVYTDVVNGVLMTFGVLGALAWLLFQVGGVDEVIATADAAGKWSWFGNWANERVGDTPGPVIAISFFVPTMLLLLGDANMYQRIFSARHGNDARKAVFFWVIGVVVLESAISGLGLLGSVAADKGLIHDHVAEHQVEVRLEVGEELRAAGIALESPEGAAKMEEELLTAYQADSEAVIPGIARHGLPLPLGLLLVATMMAIIVSTADSFLLIPATNLTRDVYQRMRPATDERAVLLISRGLVLALGLVAYFLVSQFDTVLKAAFAAYNVYGTSIAPSLLAAFLWKRATRQGAIASIVTGAGITLVWTFVFEKYGILGFEDWNMFLRELTYPAAGFSVLVLVVVSLATPPPPPEAIEPFFSDVPLPTLGSGAGSLYEESASLLGGGEKNLADFAGQVTLVVNVASECGFTPQYEGLQALHDELGPRGFSVLGFPSNEFGGQEPGDARAIRAFCESRFSVTFPLFAKTFTGRGGGQSQVYRVLGRATGSLPTWNFCKYLVARDGTVLEFFAGDVAPDDPRLRAAIERALG